MLGNIFSNLKNKAVGALLQRKLRDLPKDQQEQVIAMVQNNPELFKKIGEEIEAGKNAGQNEFFVTLQVMKKYENQLRGLTGK